MTGLGEDRATLPAHRSDRSGRCKLASEEFEGAEGPEARLVGLNEALEATREAVTKGRLVS